MTFGLNAIDWEFLIKNILLPLKKKGVRTYVFGSRARGDHKPFSDLDILLESPKPISLSEMQNYRGILEDSNLPIKVELIERRDLAKNYEQDILKERILVEP